MAKLDRSRWRARVGFSPTSLDRKVELASYAVCRCRASRWAWRTLRNPGKAAPVASRSGPPTSEGRRLVGGLGYCAPMPNTGRLLLGPGHLGDPKDLSLRVVQALREADLVVIEQGSDHGYTHICTSLNLPVRPTVSLPGSGLPEAVKTRVLGVLDHGGMVLLFGVDEGIPAYADPGAVVVGLVRTERPLIPVRSLGGSSVLGAAFLASGLSDDRVTVLGVTTAPPDQKERKFREALRWAERFANGHHVLALLTTGEDAVELASRLARIRWMTTRLVVCVSITRPEERVIDGDPRHILANPPPANAPCVVFVRSMLRRTHPRGWFALLRLIAT